MGVEEKVWKLKKEDVRKMRTSEVVGKGEGVDRGNVKIERKEKKEQNVRKENGWGV